MTDEQYYENQENWGSFITLENVIDNIMLTAGHDSYFKNVERHQLSIYAKQGLKRLDLDIGNKKTMAVELNPTKVIPYPNYMLDWHRVSVLTDCETLQELKVNNTPSTSHYLQDHNGDLLYDHNGNVLESHDQDIDHAICIKRECETPSPCQTGNYSESWVKDKGNHFVFSDDLVGKVIVIEYTISSLTSIKDCDIKISNKLELALDNWIRYNALRDMRNVPNVIWQGYYQTFKIEKRRAKSLSAPKLSLIQILSAVSKRF